MKEYTIEYTETYSDIYKVKASSFDEACEILAGWIGCGKANGPDQCIDSNYKEVCHE